MRLMTVLALIVIGCAADPAAPAPSAGQPNIIIFMVDDLGWNHISAARATMGTHKKAYLTPNLEKLADQGLSFTHAYAQPNCAPTRAAMLSGQYPARIHNDVYVVGSLNRLKGKGNSKGTGKYKGPEQSEDVAPEAVTIAEALKKNGYSTAHIGKYHVGGHRGPGTLPEKAGFDVNFGGHSAGNQKACFATEQGGKWDFPKTGLGHFSRFAAPYTEAYVKKHGFPKELVGTPKHITDAVTDALEETISQFHKKGNPFYIQFHTYAVHGPVKSRPDLLKDAGRRKPNGIKPDYIGFVSSVDVAAGRLMAALEDPDGDGDTSDSISRNTLVLFTSDNGGTHADNLPLKGKKGMFTEGGIRVPLIARWPGVIAPNGVTDHMVHAVDYYQTCLELAENKWRPNADEHPLDGKSFLDILRNPQTTPSRGAIFYLFPGYLDTRAAPCVVAIDDMGGKRFKLYYLYESDSWELYCITDDIGEEKDIIESHQAIAKQLAAKMQAWLNQEHPTWKPKYPLDTGSSKPIGPPPAF